MILAEAPKQPVHTADPLTQKVIGEAMYVHRVLGPGFLESIYQNALRLRLDKAGISVKAQHPLSVYFEDTIVGQFFVDLLIEEKLIIELKAVSSLVSAHEVQLVNYLTGTGIDTGLLLNFGARSLEIKRKSRTLAGDASPFPNQVNHVNPV